MRMRALIRPHSSRTLVELASLRDKCSALAQEVASLTRERGELDARLTESKSEREQITNDLVEAKVELARLREMEVSWCVRRRCVGLRGSCRTDPVCVRAMILETVLCLYDLCPVLSVQF